MATAGSLKDTLKTRMGITNSESAARLEEIPEDLMTKCDNCGTLLVTKDWLRDLKVCSRCGYHARLSAPERIELLVDPDSFQEWDTSLAPRDPLHFPGYQEKRTAAQVKTHLKDSCVTGAATLEERPIAIGATDFRFMGGSMGSVFGEKVTRLLERALEEKRPAIMVISTGGARMQEGLLSLMQMAKTSAAVARLQNAGVPYIVVLTDPSTAGVQASFASLGDVIMAEPGATIGFTGARVIEQNLKIRLPKDFQSSEFQMEHGQLDLIVPRAKLKETITQFLGLLLD
ncbi:MAG: acetyl-CoA carboxylase carboxyltransferase subunit beta [Abitibacteriaceae bacterium]|nr:acetyl-CoA carboxylase carboxyltransferase subunit beta [Abditibacteriaceae bacterium]MBV9866440.1 acetyl-CoA carboxylase carboxyltransferase subunit beta [Abditibacteriaceae bacterium]